MRSRTIAGNFIREPLCWTCNVKGDIMIAKSLVCIAVALLCGACATMSESRVTTTESVPLIPRSVLFGNPDKAAPRLSPDGTQLAFLAPLDGVLNVWVAPVDDIAAARPVTRDTQRGIMIYFWSYAPNRLIYLQDKEGNENWHVHVVNLETDEARNLTPVEGVRAIIENVDYKFPNEILIGLNNRTPELFDIYRLNILTGERTLIQENPGFSSFITDDQYRIRFAARMLPDGGREILEPLKDGEWTTFMQIDMADAMTTSPIGFDKTGNILYLIDSRGRNTAAMVTRDLRTGDVTTVAENPKADTADALIKPKEQTIQAVAFDYERKHWQFIDPEVEADFAVLAKVARGDIEIVSRDLEDTVWIVAYVQDAGPVRYYRYDRASQNAAFLFTNRSALEGQPLVQMHPVIITSRDGLELVSYLTLPKGASLNEQANLTAPGPLPMVLLVHGGPWARSSWGYDPQHQWLANRGYAVLDVNFRGSTGFGKAFINAGNMEWGAKMHDDLIDAVNWAVERGIADPTRVAIFGGSYGGYAALAGLTFTPETFACAISVVGPPDLVALINSIPPYWKPQLSLFTTRVGNPFTEEGKEFLLSRSPITYVDRIKRPLLVGQGANDPRVIEAETTRIVNVMQEKNIPVTYLLYPDEGHGFVRPENRLSFNAVADLFLAEFLGGRAEPVGDDFEGSSVTIPAGADAVSGLAEEIHMNAPPSSQN